MNKKLLSQLITTLELIQSIATEAWWQGHSAHCGSDFNRLTCKPCFAFEQCKRHEKLATLFAELHKAEEVTSQDIKRHEEGRLNY